MHGESSVRRIAHETLSIFLFLSPTLLLSPSLSALSLCVVHVARCVHGCCTSEKHSPGSRAARLHAINTPPLETRAVILRDWNSGVATRVASFFFFSCTKKTILFFEWFSVGSLCCLFIVREENQGDDVIRKEKRIRSGIYGKERSCRRGPQEDAEWVSRSLYWRNRVSSRFSSPAEIVANFANRYTRGCTTYFVWFQLKSLDPQGNLERWQTSDKPLWTHA